MSETWRKRSLLLYPTSQYQGRVGWVGVQIERVDCSKVRAAAPEAADTDAVQGARACALRTVCKALSTQRSPLLIHGPSKTHTERYTTIFFGRLFSQVAASERASIHGPIALKCPPLKNYKRNRLRMIMCADVATRLRADSVLVSNNPCMEHACIVRTLMTTVHFATAVQILSSYPLR